MECSRVIYLRKRIYMATCKICNGHGIITEKVYHNQLKDCKCYSCQGTGKVEQTETVDVTNLVLALMDKDE
ncbi:MAG: hypothetical protein PF694_09150 [Bacteroidetes bacterium]|nr:hypothetical protein [Bacteroidota bacterium]